MHGLSIYLHIPFCRTKCTYCAFNTYTNLDALIEPFTQALIREIHLVGKSKPGQRVWTVFFGGGTPSLLSPEQVQRIMQAIRQHFIVDADAEISLESNPNDLNERAYLEGLRAAGINRLSIGMQSANLNELTLFARRHDNDQVVKAVSNARLAGFDNLNLDLIYGIPHQTLTDWANTLDQMLRLKPEHVSLYALGLEDDTPMQSWVASGKLPTPDDDLAADMYELATERLNRAAYEQYEISNWAKPGRQCRHNLQYWRNWDYIGLGPGAHGWAGGVRYATILSPQRYIKAMQEIGEEYPYPHTPATDQPVMVERGDEIAETLIMGLRLTREGISREEFRARFGVDLLELHGEVINKYVQHELLYVDDDVVRITTKGRLMSNMVFRDLV